MIIEKNRSPIVAYRELLHRHDPCAASRMRTFQLEGVEHEDNYVFGTIAVNANNLNYVVEGVETVRPARTLENPANGFICVCLQTGELHSFCEETLVREVELEATVKPLPEHNYSFTFGLH